MAAELIRLVDVRGDGAPTVGAQDDAIRAICELFERLRPYAAVLDAQEPRTAVQLAVVLEDVGNRLIDLSDTLLSAHLAAYNATLPDDLPDDTEFDAVA